MKWIALISMFVFLFLMINAVVDKNVVGVVMWGIYTLGMLIIGIAYRLEEIIKEQSSTKQLSAKG